MDSLFIANSMMCLNMQQMHFQQHINDQLLLSGRKPFSYTASQLENSTPYIQCKSCRRGVNYKNNTFGAVEKEPLFDDVEIIDIQKNTILCYFKVEIVSREEVRMKCEIKKGYMFEEDVLALIQKQIVSALKNDYKKISKISAVVGKSDEMAEGILSELGFEVVNPMEEKDSV